MRREFLDFRTPQHPSLGTNNWGGASPLLARNIPKESLETKYLRITSTRTRDEIFPCADEFVLPPPPSPEKLADHGPQHRWGVLVRWLGGGKKLGGDGARQKKRSRWLPGGNPRYRWPQGWC